MAHIGSEGFSGGWDEETIARRIDDLLKALSEPEENLEGATAEILGGADVLGIFPQHARQHLALEQAKLLERQLIGKGIRVTRTRVGGTKARAVQLSLPGGRVDMRPVGRGSRSGVLPPEAPHTNSRDESRNARNLEDVVVNMGCLEVARGPTRLTAVLGSCVGIALFDPATGVGGLAHVMLPRHEGRNGNRAKFANTAVSALVLALTHAGATPGNLKAKLVGGANVLRVDAHGVFPQISRDNIRESREALAANGIEILWEDVGGRMGRKILVDLQDFRILVKILTGGKVLTG